MPWVISERAGKLGPVEAQAAGGYTRATRPNPNSAIDIFRRNVGSLVSGASTMFERPQAARSLSSGGELMANLARARRGLEMREAERQAALAKGGLTAVVQGIQTVGSDPQWEALKQALYEAGADRVSTGAAARPGQGGGAAGMGFFERQAAPLAVQNQQAQLAAALAAQEQADERAATLDRLNREQQAFAARYARLQSAPLRRTTRGGESGYTIE